MVVTSKVVENKIRLPRGYWNKPNTYLVDAVFLTVTVARTYIVWVTCVYWKSISSIGFLLEKTALMRNVRQFLWRYIPGGGLHGAIWAARGHFRVKFLDFVFAIWERMLLYGRLCYVYFNSLDTRNLDHDFNSMFFDFYFIFVKK